MDASVNSVAELLEGGSVQYQVPLYQRPFSWEEDRLEQLWDDIIFQAKAAAAGNRKVKPHFLGAVVLVKPSEEESKQRVLEIVDGQQRFTALTLLLAAIRDRYRDLGIEQEAERISDNCLANRHGKDDSRLRLLPTPSDLGAYRSIILDWQPANLLHHREQLVTKAYEFFRKKVGPFVPESGLPTLTQIEAAIAERLNLVRITVKEEENPHAIFESLNSKGMALSQSDLLRNFLFMKLGTDSSEIYDKYWRALQERLGDVHTRLKGQWQRKEDHPGAVLDRLLWMQLVISGENEVKIDQLFKDTQRALFRDDDSAPKIITYVQEVYRRSQHFVHMLDPDSMQHPGLRMRLSRLARWNMDAIDPVVLLLLDKREQGALSDWEAEHALLLTESFLVRRMLVGGRYQGMPGVFQKAAREIRESTSPLKNLHEFLSQRTWARDEEIRNAFIGKDFYSTSNSNSAHRTFVLHSLEAAYRHPEPVDLSNRGITIEHILPQKPPSDGPSWWETIREDAASMPDPRPSQRDLHGQLVHLIGNLTLSGENDKLGNRSFEHKKELLSRSNLSMNRGIVEKERWGRAEILERCDELAELAIKVWPGPLQ